GAHPREEPLGFRGRRRRLGGRLLGKTGKQRRRSVPGGLVMARRRCSGRRRSGRGGGRGFAVYRLGNRLGLNLNLGNGRRRHRRLGLRHGWGRSDRRGGLVGLAAHPAKQAFLAALAVVVALRILLGVFWLVFGTKH